MKKITMNKIAKLICEGEGKKHQVNIADVKEVLRVLRKILRTDHVALFTFLKYVLGKK